MGRSSLVLMSLQLCVAEKNSISLPPLLELLHRLLVAGLAGGEHLQVRQNRLAVRDLAARVPLKFSSLQPTNIPSSFRWRHGGHGRQRRDALTHVHHLQFPSALRIPLTKNQFCQVVRLAKMVRVLGVVLIRNLAQEYDPLIPNVFRQA